jgi:hypothetical protein
MRKYIILIGVLLSFGCNQFIQSERNIIKFKVSSTTVEDSLKRMNILMDKLTPIEGEMINYFFDNDGSFYINSQKLGRINELDVDTIRTLRNLSLSEKREFLSLVIFLKDNYISSTHKDKPCKCYLYEYRAVDDKSFFMNRTLYLNQKGKSYETLLGESKVLDSKGKIILIGAK